MSMLPKSSAKPPVEASLKPGALTVYENQGTCLTACILEFKKPKYLVLNECGAELELAPERLHQLPQSLPSKLSSVQDKADYLAQLSRQARLAAGSLDLDELWSLVQEEGNEYKNGELCALYFGKDDLENHLALRLALVADAVYFKRKKELFAPRPPEVVEELKRAEEIKRRKLEIQHLTVKAFEQRLKDRNAPLPPELEPSIDLLEETAAAADMDNARQKEVKELLTLCSERLKLELGGRREEQAYTLLRRIGHFNEFTNLALIRNRIGLAFGEAALAQAEQISPPAALEECEDRSLRVDLTALPAFTVDDASTQDMDDAVSIETTPDGFRLGVHISDVASLIPPGSALDLEARQRGTSFYFPDRTINMLPERLSQSVCSLIQDQVRPCISCLWEVDRGFNVSAGKIMPSLIKVRRRLCYDEVDRRLHEGDHELGAIYNIAATLEMERFKQGGFKVNKREVMVVLKGGGELALVEVDENAPARSMIGELMVLCNQLIAGFAIEKGIPMVYRTQQASETGAAPQTAQPPAGPAADYLVRSALKPTALSFDAAPHATLGIPAYLHMTSPIRRYIDLCNQRQLLWYLRGAKPLLAREEYESLLSATEESRSAAGSVSKETRRFWLLKYLERRVKSSRTIQATVLRTDFKTPLVELEEIYMPTLVRLPAGFKPGSVVTLRIGRVDAAFDDLRLEVVQ
jgi:exoribonuclease II